MGIGSGIRQGGGGIVFWRRPADSNPVTPTISRLSGVDPLSGQYGVAKGSFRLRRLAVAASLLLAGLVAGNCVEIGLRIADRLVIFQSQDTQVYHLHQVGQIRAITQARDEEAPQLDAVAFSMAATKLRLVSV